MPPLYEVKGPIKAHGKRMTDGQVELPELVGSRLVIDGYLELAGAEFAAPMFDGLLGSPSLPLVTDLPNDEKLLAAELVRHTFELSQLSVEEWNALPQEDRDSALVDQLDEILYGVQLKDFELADQLQQNNRDPGDEHAPPREIATHTQPGDDKGRDEGSITGNGGGVSAPSSESTVNSESQGSGPNAGESSATPPAGESTATATTTAPKSTAKKVAVKKATTKSSKK